MGVWRWVAPGVLVVLAACGSWPSAFQSTERSQVLGEWCGADGDRMQLGDDGTAAISGMSAKLGQRLIGQYDQPVTPTLDGSWGWEVTGKSYVTLTFAPVPPSTGSRVERLRVANDGEKIRLLAYFGDFDSGYDYSFERCV
ncbi:hypothetical protein [Dactylosporangium sp. NPDC000521]|uniref:hypothetical protein n=1 Tax=Dactylosporangium sp. NPDC000521 TaxID=3363975 RepID=UPI0036B989D5